MTIHLLFFAQARERAGAGSATLELPEGSRVRDALAKVRERYPALVELMPHLAVAMNQRLVGGEEPVLEGAELALLPPVSGGSAPRLVAPATRRQVKQAVVKPSGKLRVTPVTAERWGDLETLFGPRGACAGCWCMWCRLTGAEFKAGKGDGNKRRLRKLAKEGPPPGLIGYLGKEPVAWCAIGPREHFRRLAGSRTLAPVDEQAVWSVPCFFVARGFRGAGLTARMLEGAVNYARARGARIVEGYPIEPGGKTADAFAWWGLTGAFEKAGFREVLRRSPTHPIMRRSLGRGAGGTATRTPRSTRTRG